MTSAPLAIQPPCTSVPVVCARTLVMVGGALVVAAAAFGGLYPQFDDGKLRVLLGFSTGTLACVALHVALRAPSRLAGMGCVVGLSMLFGIVNSIVPGIILTKGDELVFALVFGAVFGIPTGLLYGLSLAALVGLVHEPLRGTSLDADDRTRARLGGWAAILGVLVILIASSFAQTMYVLGATAPLVFVGLALLVRHARRIRARRSWTKRVRAGLDPVLRVRGMAPTDPAGLPRFGDGQSVVVVEWVPSAADGLYRTAAGGVPLAVVTDDDRLDQAGRAAT
jgi:hypothetical protein